MATNELMTLIAETRERLAKMEVLAQQMNMAAAKEPKKRSKTTKKDASAAPLPPLPAPSAAEMEAETDAETEAEEVASAAPKKPINAWINFTIRVNNVLNENDAKLPGAEQKQFCGALKDEALEKLKKDKMTAEDYAIISTEAILWARKVWSKPEASKQFLAGKNKDKPSSSSDSSSDSENKSGKKRGRPSKKIAAIIEEYGAAIAEDAKMGATV